MLRNRCCKFQKRPRNSPIAWSQQPEAMGRDATSTKKYSQKWSFLSLSLAIVIILAVFCCCYYKETIKTTKSPHHSKLTKEATLVSTPQTLDFQTTTGDSRLILASALGPHAKMLGTVTSHSPQTLPQKMLLIVFCCRGLKEIMFRDYVVERDHFRDYFLVGLRNYIFLSHTKRSLRALLSTGRHSFCFTHLPDGIRQESPSNRKVYRQLLAYID